MPPAALAPLGAQWAQAVPPPAGDIGSWAIGVLVAAVVALFGFYTRELLRSRDEERAEAKEATAELRKNTDVLKDQTAVIAADSARTEKQIEEIRQLRGELDRLYGALHDLTDALREGRPVPPPRPRRGS